MDRIRCALLSAPDGTIRARNRAADLAFPADATTSAGSTIWDYIIDSAAEQLRERLDRLSDTGGRDDSRLLLNLTAEQITLEVGLIPCRGAILLLASHERRSEADYYAEILALTNRQSVMMREDTKKNRTLQAAYKVIEQLARTDSLTGLANRRMLDETLAREISRAEREGVRLSLVMGDLDHFKSINDDYGHVTGDAVLARVADIIDEALRAGQSHVSVYVDVFAQSLYRIGELWEANKINVAQGTPRDGDYPICDRRNLCSAASGRDRSRQHGHHRRFGRDAPNWCKSRC
jgi:hypothetical protein